MNRFYHASILCLALVAFFGYETSGQITITCPAEDSTQCASGDLPPYATYSAFTSAGGSAAALCGIDTSTFAFVSGMSDGLSCPETITRTYAIEDSCGGKATCQQTIIVLDTEPFIVSSCPINILVSCPEDIPAPYGSWIAFLTAPGLNIGGDNCGLADTTGVSPFVGEVSDGNSCPEVITRTYQIVDSCGNSATCQQLVIINDLVAPVMACPPDTLALCDLSEVATFVDLDAFLAAGGSVSDNCGLDSASFTFVSESSDNALCPETVTRIYQLTDSCGNVSQCEHFVLVNDTIPPMIACPPGSSAQCDLTEVPAYATLQEFLDDGGTVNDNCAIDSMSFMLIDQFSDGLSCPETVTRIYSILDSCGNPGTCRQNIIINDTIPFQIIACPTDIVVQCAADVPAPYTTWIGFLTAPGLIIGPDNCGLADTSSTIPFVSEVSDGLSCPETIMRTYQLVDSCGNVATCQQFIVVNDLVSPTLTCPSEVNFQCDDFQVDNSIYESWADFVSDGGSASDNCGIDTLTFTLITEVSDGMTCPQTYTRTYAVTDSCGNTARCQQTVIVNDTIPPVINSCPDDIVVNCLADVPAPYPTWLAFLTAPGLNINPDNCGTADTMNYLPFVDEINDGLFCPRTITRRYQFVDQCGNADTCVQLIIVNDTIAPDLNCPADTTVLCDSDLPPALTTLSDFTAAGGTASDNCGIIEGSFSFVSEVLLESCPTRYQRTYIVSDSCGNVTTCIRILTANDSIAPAMTCPDDIEVACSFEVPLPYATYSDFAAAGGAATDICVIDLSTFTLASEVTNGASCPETITRTYQVEDTCGNIGTCMQLIIVNDTIAPLLTCPPDITISCTESTDTSNTGVGTATDNCGGVGIVYGDVNGQNPNVNSCGHYQYTIVRTWLATDSCGNPTTCSHTIEVVDTAGPVQTDIIAFGGSGIDACDFASSGLTEPTIPELLTSFMDSCSGSLIAGVLESTVDSGDICGWSRINTYTITDVCNNPTTVQIVWSGSDMTPPVITCPVDVTIECTESTDTSNTGVATATDNCGAEVTITFSDASTQDPDPTACEQYEYEITRTWTGTDSCGNVSTCVQSIEVRDILPPYQIDTVAFGGSDIDACDFTASGIIEPAISDLLISFEDSCSGSVLDGVLTSSVDSGDACGWTHTNTYSISDPCGNAIALVIVWSGSDMTAPVIACAPDITISCTESTDTSNTGSTTASDACTGVAITFSDVSTQNPSQQDCGFYEYQITRTWTAADSCGNSSTCVQLIQVIDTAAPYQIDTVPFGGTGIDACDFAGSGIAEPLIFELLSSFEDSCSGMFLGGGLVTSVDSGNVCGWKRTNTYVINDVCGNGAPLVITWSGSDMTAPEITCPPNIRAFCSILEQPPYADFTAFVAAGGTARDSCGIDESTFTLLSEVSNGLTCPETVTRTYQIMDSCGNATTCRQNVVINDLVPPAISCPSGDAAECSASEIPVYNTIEEFVAGGGTISDNCQLDSSSFSMIGEFTSMPDATCLKVVTRTYEVSDFCGNLSSCFQFIIVADTEDPVLTCPATDSVICDISEVAPFADLAEFLAAGGSLYDSCGIVDSTFTLVSEVSDGLSCPETITRTYQVVDSCGNIGMCDQLIVVDDTIRPILATPSDITIECFAELPAPYSTFADFALDGGTASDNCTLDTASFTFVADVYDQATCPGTIEREYSILDICGNAVSSALLTRIQTFTINDTTAPSLTCPPDTSAVCDISEVLPFASYAEFAASGGSSSDNCGIVDTTFTLLSEVSDGLTCPETVTRTYIVLDSCGNSATCVQDVIINDTIPPLIMCPPSDTVQCLVDVPAAFASVDEFVSGGGTTSDNCDIDSASFMLVNETQTEVGCSTLIDRQYAVSDLCGNSVSCNQSYWVIDTIAPVTPTPPADTLLACADDVPAAIDLTAIDNCTGAITVSPTEVTTSGTCINDFVLVRTWTFTDSCCNTSSVTQTITVRDTLAPVTPTPPADTLGGMRR